MNAAKVTVKTNNEVNIHLIENRFCKLYTDYLFV